MKICLVSSHFSPFVGGVETHVERIAYHLVQAGDDVTIFTQAEHPGDVGVEIMDGICVRRFGVPLSSRHFGISPALLKALIVEKGSWDIVHAHGYHGAAPLLSALARMHPLVFTPHYHGTGHSTGRKLLHVPYRLLGKRIAAASDAVICVSNAERSLFLADFAVGIGKTTVIPNGVDVERIWAVQPAQSDKKIVVSAGRLETYKHVELTLNAFVHLGAEFHLVVTGDGPERARLEDLASTLGIGSKVSFLGVIEVHELYGWFRRASAYVSMSTNEAMPVTILEVLACGVRVIASDIPAHKNLESSYPGWLTTLSITTPPRELASEIRSAAIAPIGDPPVVPTWTDVSGATREVYEQVLKSA